MHRVKDWLFVLAVFVYFVSSCQQSPAREDKRPNIVLIVADDLGYSDLGCFGSEISTPSIDGLARQGRIFTSFYTAATCSPTRAMLLSGTDNHVAGLGNMAEPMIGIPEQLGKPGYEGYLNDRVVSIAQLVKDQGYHTYIAGKWHLGLTPDQSPKAKGFERSFTLLNAATNHFYPYRDDLFWHDNDYTRYPDGQYSTDFYTDQLIQFINGGQSDGKPFFLVAAYTSPHWPLQAPADFIEKYEGRYDIGYDSLRSLRFEGLKARGLIPTDLAIPDLPSLKGELYHVSNRPLLPWESLSGAEKKIEARKMEIYAGMVSNLDYNVGRLVDHLKAIDQYDNTLIVFLSDNGAAVLEYNYTPEGLDQYEAMGTANSFVAYGPQWAHASSAAFRLYKGYSTEGGIRTPMIVKMPGQSESKEPTNVVTTVMDLAPTFLDLVGGEYPDGLAPYKGESLIPFLKNERGMVHDPDYVMGWELFGRGAIRQGDWKITQVESPFGNGAFQLYNLAEDPAESEDLSSRHPQRYQDMLSHWEDYVRENGVILLDN